MELLVAEDDRPELLVLRALKLGDLLVAVPAIRGLRRGFPEHRLILAVPGWLEPIVGLIGGVDALLPTPGLNSPLPLCPGRIDVAVNMHGRGRESRHLIDLLNARVTMAHRVAGFAEPAGSQAPSWRNDLHERSRWVRLVQAYGVAADPDDLVLNSPEIEPVVAGAVVVHVGAFYGSRQWPVERFAVVARELARRGQPVVFTGSSSEALRAAEVATSAGLPQESVLAGRLGLAEFAAVIEAATVLISADTGAAHLASAYRTPSVVLFGPAPPEEWGPPSQGPHIVLTDSAVRRGETFADEPDPAILAVGTQDVLAAVDSLWAARG